MVTVTGGEAPFQYLWTNGQTNATAIGLAAGTYTVTVTGNNGRTATAPAFIGLLAPQYQYYSNQCLHQFRQWHRHGKRHRWSASLSCLNMGQTAETAIGLTPNLHRYRY
ncbi:MAG: hypothetical protein IPL65_17045 [Lewinellaceae bacterium]|nr:hypothetical protein [Lewinellaceae bacterium]